jgi:hypothetical protein
MQRLAMRRAVMRKGRWCVGVLALAAVGLLASCSEEIIVHAHASVTDLDFEGEHVGTLTAGQETTVKVGTSGRTQVTWKYNGSSESDYIAGNGVDANRVWHLYASYGSWDEW